MKFYLFSWRDAYVKNEKEKKMYVPIVEQQIHRSINTAND